MFQYRHKVAADTPQELLYTFKNPVTKQVISLTAYTTVHVHAKREGVDMATAAVAQFVDKAAGTVRLAAMNFADPGMWTTQFVCDANTLNELFGEKALFEVVKNVRDLDVNELPSY